MDVDSVHPTDSTSVRYKMIVEKDVPIRTRDGSEIYADVFRPDSDGRFPVIMSQGPYPKDIHLSEWSPKEYSEVAERGPYMHWETANPESWVPHGYVQVRVYSW